MVAVWEPRAGVLFADACITAHLAQARRHGAELHYEESVAALGARAANGIRVLTSQGEYRARQLIVTAGAWISALFPDLPLRIERQVLFWFDARKRFRACSLQSAARFICGSSTGVASSTAFRISATA